MIARIKPFRKAAVTEALLARENLGLRKYRKTAARDPEAREILLDLALKKIAKAEHGDCLLRDFRKRRVAFTVAGRRPRR